MKIAALQEMIEQDSKLDISNLDHNSLETATLQAKYYNLYANMSRDKRLIENDLEEIRLFKFRYYKGQCEPAVYKEKPLHESMTNAQAEAHANTDPEVQKLSKQLDLLDIKLELVKDMKKSLDGRQWQIRNAIEFLKFKAGM